MAESINKVILIGNVGRDPEVRTTQDGKEIVNFPFATSETWKDKTTGERKEKTEWHKIVIFAPALVSIAKNYIFKGSKLYLEGALQTRKWVDQNNLERFTTEVILQPFRGMLMLLNSKNSNLDTPTNSSSTPQNDQGNSELDEDAIPF